MEIHNFSDACSIVVDYVISQVENKEYNVGEKLPPERALAKMLNVSRATVREAIKVLNFLGFIDSNQGSGNYITNTYDKTSARIMKVMFLRGEVDFDDFTKFRQMLELQSFDLALEKATDKQKTEMKQVVDLMDLTADSSLIFNLDNRFHTLLAESSHNPLIIINFQALSTVLTKYMSDTYVKTVTKKDKGFEQLQKYHHAIIDALIEGNRAKGEQAIKDHFSCLY